MDVTPTQSSEPLDRTNGATLQIEAIEVTPIRVPLAKEYRGSYYGMRNRATVVTRVVTRDGIVGEAYAGDEDSTLLDIATVIEKEITPKLIGQSALRLRALLGERLSGHVRPAPRSTHRPGRAGVCRLRDLGRDRQGAGRAAVAVVGRLPRRDPRQHHRRLLRP